MGFQRMFHRQDADATIYGVRCGADCKLSGIARFGESGEAISGGCLLAG